MIDHTVMHTLTLLGSIMSSTLQNSLRFEELIIIDGRELHNLIVEGKFKRICLVLYLYKISIS